MVASIGQLWFNPVRKNVLVITDIKKDIIHFHFLNDPDGVNGRNSKLFYSLYQPCTVEILEHLVES